MATPKKRKSLTRRKRSRAHDKIVLPNIVNCESCAMKKLQHNVCLNCGIYKGNIIFLKKARETAQ